MLIVDKKRLEKYAPKYRLWQGISSIERTEKGRIFICFYSGGNREEIRNYCVLLYSDDGGKTFVDPAAIVVGEGIRHFDPNVWIDPLGRLWFTYTRATDGEYDLCASVCDNPDADELVFHEERRIGDGVMMCKPTVLSTGEWIFPIAKWRNGRWVGVCWKETDPEDRKAFVYRTADNGKTFERLGGVDAPTRSFDEHMVVEKRDGSLWMLIRCTDGIAEAFSWDGGRNWSCPIKSEIKGPDSRFFIRRLRSGRLLLLNHYDFDGRNNMTAFLSDDDGKTWSKKLLLDSRRVSYPDAKESDGKLYITYDFERGGYRKTVEENYTCARQILMTVITEEEIWEQTLGESTRRISTVASQLGIYEGEDNPCGELDKYTAAELAKIFLERYPKQEVAMRICEAYPFSCLSAPNWADLDEKIEAVDKAQAGSLGEFSAVKTLVSLLRQIPATAVEVNPVVDRVKSLLDTQLEFGLEECATQVGVSKYYLSHLFKKQTGVSIPEYKKARRLLLAKKKLIQTDLLVADIALECGFSSVSYFTELFTKEEGMTPTEYRKLHKI